MGDRTKLNLALWLARQAQINPSGPALFLGVDCVADYAEFWFDARAIGAGLRAAGVCPGDRVALYMHNSPAFLSIFYAVWTIGAVVVPVNAKLHGKEAAFILDNSGATHVFASPDLVIALEATTHSAKVVSVPGAAYEGLRAHPPAQGIVSRAPDDAAWLFYTSGTTGKPKGVIMTHRMLMSMSLCYEADVDNVTAQDCVLYAAPMSHGAGIYNMIHVRVGARHICPPSGGFEAQEILDLAAHFGRTQMFAAPTMVKRLTGFAKATWRRGEGFNTIVYAGGPMYTADIIEAVNCFGPVFVQIYGQGECPMGISVLPRAEVADRSHPDWKARLQSVGRAQSAVEVAIGRADGSLLPIGEHGEIMVRGDTVMPGYWRNPEATAKTLVNGWLMTGDMGYMDADGYVTLRDRSKDMIITGGSNVYPREVEEVLLTDAKVEEVSVVGRPHPEWGEEVVAFVVGDADADELDALCLSHIARFKRPKAYFFVDALPKNNYGKILKTELRARLEGQAEE